MNKNIIKKITATALCGVLALTSVAVANAASEDKSVEVLGETFTLGEGQLGASAFNLDSNDSVYATYESKSSEQTYEIDFVPLSGKVKTFSFPKDDEYEVTYFTYGSGSGMSGYRKIYNDDMIGEYTKIRVKLHDIYPSYFSENGTTTERGYDKYDNFWDYNKHDKYWDYNYKTQHDGNTEYSSYLVFKSNGFMTACAPDKNGYVEIYVSSKIGSDLVFSTDFRYRNWVDDATGSYGGLIGHPVYELIVGNADGDGSISVKDATEIQKYIVNEVSFSDFQSFVADVNHDGKINIFDVTLIQKYIGGLI